MFKLQRNTIAAIAIAIALFSMPAMSVAQAKQSAEATSSSHKAIYNTTSPISRPKTDPIPRYNTSFPEGSPDFHGSNGG
jgi:hypothetical protein